MSKKEDLNVGFRSSVPVVGIGASTCGLERITPFLKYTRRIGNELILID